MTDAAAGRIRVGTTRRIYNAYEPDNLICYTWEGAWRRDPAGQWEFPAALVRMFACCRFRDGELYCGAERVPPPGSPPGTPIDLSVDWFRWWSDEREGYGPFDDALDNLPALVIEPDEFEDEDSPDLGDPPEP